MLLFQEVGEHADAVGLRDVELVVLDFRQAAISGQHFGRLQFLVLMECGESFLAPLLVPRCEIDEEGAVVESRLGVLEGKLAD